VVKEMYLGDAELRDRNQITIPSGVIEFFGLNPGDKLLFTKKGDEIIIIDPRKIGAKKNGK